jgi:serine phosphatase RsbU (regulator of sigma subunit)
MAGDGRHTGSQVPVLDAPAAPAPAVTDGSAAAFLAEVGGRLSGLLHLGRCLRAVAELSVRFLADSALVVGPPGRSGAAWVRMSHSGPEAEPATDAASAGEDQDVAEVPGLAEALARYPGGPSRLLEPATFPAWLMPDPAGRIRQLLLVPMPGNAAPGGALVLARAAGRPGFSDADMALADAFAARAGAAVSAAALHGQQAEAMAVLQADLLPPDLPVIGGVALAGSYQPGEGGLLAGGDFYDVLPAATADTGAPTLVVLGDVCGRGARAAALTGRVRQTLRALRLLERRPGVLLRVLNETLLEQGRTGLFVTLVVGLMARVPRGRLRLTFATGGHPPPLVLREAGAVEEVPVAGPLVGVLPTPQFRTASVVLAPGDLCLLYSDGMTEARGGTGGREQFGDDRLRRSLGSCRGMPAAATLERLRQLVSDWTHDSGGDDIAMLAVQAHRPAGP